MLPISLEVPILVVEVYH